MTTAIRLVAITAVAFLAGVAQAAAQGDSFAVFEPAPTRENAVINYDVWTEALRPVMFYMGPSLRQRALRPQPTTGSRVVFGHSSPFRLEGNRIRFSAMDETFITGLSNYRSDLELTGNEIPLTSFSRNEQLAYWINLHNVVVIEQIAKSYPVVRPSEITVEGVPFQEAKLLTVSGVPLSLKDIRENIVYRYWNDPKVMYGFFRGDIGSPSIQGEAYTGANVGLLLYSSGRDYVNSLRGAEVRSGALYVSDIYFEARNKFFPNWPFDLQNHLLEYAKPETEADLNFSLPVRSQQYDPVIADLAGGSTRRGPISQVRVDSGDGYSRELGMQQTPQVTRMLREFNDKVVTLRKKNGSRGTVTIIDIPTDPDQKKEEEEEVE